ncbi:MAG TPA: hypothetical protein VIN11_03555, partial [Roseivirga sp.]
MNKEVLRALFLEKRLTLTQAELQRRNALLFKNCQRFLKNHPKIEHAHIFISMAEKHEPDTLKLIDWLVNEKKMKVYSSRTFYRERKLTHHQVFSSKDFKLAKSG